MTKILLKIGLLGDGGVGKTQLRQRFAGKPFNPRGYCMTICADFHITQIQVVDHKGRKYEIKLQIWDLAGQPRFRAVRNLYFYGSHGFILLFDVTLRDTFDNISLWIEEAWEANKKPIPVVIGGSKIDLRADFPKSVTKREGKEKVAVISQITQDTYGFPIHYCETSAKTGEGVVEIFNTLALTMIKKK